MGCPRKDKLEWPCGEVGDDRQRQECVVTRLTRNLPVNFFFRVILSVCLRFVVHEMCRNAAARSEQADGERDWNDAFHLWALSSAW